MKFMTMLLLLVTVFFLLHMNGLVFEQVFERYYFLVH